MSRLKAIAACGAFSIAASALLARGHPFGNAGLYAQKDAAAPFSTNEVAPLAVHAILEERCADCHSQQTQAPVYGRLAPVSWLMERDILRGREAMNLSLWSTYSVDRQRTLAAKIVQEAKAREMPPLQYRMFHANALPTGDDIRILADWAHATASVEAAGANPSTGVGEPVRGKELFEKRCTGCHAFDRNREGPSLQGVFGRTSGSVQDFAYSTALKKAGIVWSEDSLQKWLADPDAFLPGNNMDFLVPGQQDRQDLVAYLKQVSAK